MTAVFNGTEPGLQSGLKNSAPAGAWAVIVAGGSGSRLSSCLGGEPKQFYLHKGAPLYWMSAKALARCACVKGLVFVFPEAYCGRENERIAELYKSDDLGLPWKAVIGGSTRAESSYNGVMALPGDCAYVFVHDAARPFLKPELVWRLFQKRGEACAVIPGVRLSDTVKTVGADGRAEGTPARESLRAVQTPQLFNVFELKKAYKELGELSEALTDDAMALERTGREVLIIDGDPRNVKITNPADLSLLKEEKPMIPLTGFGYDVHRYGEGRPLILGGVRIPCPYKVIAHSDGDVLLHALTDAVLGLGALGDIGSHFPDSGPAWSGMASSVFLDHALSMIGEKGIELSHLDLTIIAQKPVINPYKKEIAKNIARLCGLDISHVNVKATTEEGLGFTGRLEGIKAFAAVSAFKKAS